MALEFPLDGVQLPSLMALWEFSLSLYTRWIIQWQLSLTGISKALFRNTPVITFITQWAIATVKGKQPAIPNLFLGNCGHGYQATSSPPTCGVCSSVADTSLCRPLGVAIVMLHSDMRSSLWWASSCVFCRQKEWLTPSSRPSPLLPTPNPGCINKDFSLSGQAWNLSQWKPQPPPPPRSPWPERLWWRG